MARRKRKPKGCLIFIAIVVVALGAGGFWLKTETDGSTLGPVQTLVFTKQRKLPEVIDELQTKGIVKSAYATKMLAVIKNSKRIVSAGAYRVTTGMSSSDALDSLREPIKQMVRIPEMRWIARVAKVLEDKQVCKATEYIELTNQASKFKDIGIPTFDESLEGFLYPDTYNFAPGIGAEWVIRHQLVNFQKRTKDLNLTPENMRRTIIIASLVEMEASDYKERQMIAGVIENRLLKGMRLQLDPTVNYGMQLWRPLFYKDYTAVKSPYNTYLVKGLPPGPICSPSADSIRATLNPIKSNMLYYIYLKVDGKTHFAATYAEHLKNVHLRDTLKANKK